MAISINPVLPVLASPEAGSIAPELVLQPGSVVNAQVLKVLSADLVRIAIASLSIDVATEVPLQQGQNLQLAVTQTKDGIRLAVVGQGAGAAAADAVTLSPDALADLPANQPAATAPKIVLTPAERAAISAAAQAAVSEQDSLAPLFANLGAAVSFSGLPPKLREAIAQVLAQQTSLDQNLDGADIKTAFQKSGIFLEASLAAGTLPQNSAPDLKAALIVLRQTLQSALGLNATPASPAAPAAPATAQHAAPPQAATVNPAPPLAPNIDAPVLPQLRLPTAENLALASQAARGVLAPSPGAERSAGATLNLLQEALHEFGVPMRAAAAVLKDIRGTDATFHTNTPPPPVRGAPPAAQPVATPTLQPQAPLETTAHHLLDDTDAAIARQTLLQVASLPDRVDTSSPRLDTTAPRWHFEIPFATPQGTAMAQFEISRDGGHEEVEAAKRVWRARFSLDVEPAGPVHALISLTGEKTSVRLWAERSSTAEQLRAGSAQLSQALTRAELQPGDIVIRDGAPPQAAPAARAGHFLDRAL